LWNILNAVYFTCIQIKETKEFGAILLDGGANTGLHSFSLSRTVRNELDPLDRNRGLSPERLGNINNRVVEARVRVIRSLENLNACLAHIWVALLLACWGGAAYRDEYIAIISRNKCFLRLSESAMVMHLHRQAGIR
jgi:hypothetical protein